MPAGAVWFPVEKRILLVKMKSLDPHVAIVMVLCMSVGYVMLYAGVSKNALEWKRKRRICPTCGRHDSSCHCL